MYAIPLNWCSESLWHLGPGDQGYSIQQMIPGVKSTKRTSKVISEGIMFFLALECVGVDDSMEQMFRQFGEHLRRHKVCSQYSGSGYIFSNYVLIERCTLSTMKRET